MWKVRHRAFPEICGRGATLASFVSKYGAEGSRLSTRGRVGDHDPFAVWEDLPAIP